MFGYKCLYVFTSFVGIIATVICLAIVASVGSKMGYIFPILCGCAGIYYAGVVGPRDLRGVADGIRGELELQEKLKKIQQTRFCP